VWILLDNRDSFTHILRHSLLAAGAPNCMVVDSHNVSLEELIALAPERLIISPGPQTPAEAGITMAAIAHFSTRIPILGICLGHQALGLHFGAKLIKAPAPMHGFRSSLQCEVQHPLFAGLGENLEVMRYHSLALSLPAGGPLQVLARATDDGSIQAMAHRELPCVGLQFHPESVGTPAGIEMLGNWIRNGSIKSSNAS
jgi:anthranilate synthase/aminodeoxychorismate synthase-like glutamine amidotransferase